MTPARSDVRLQLLGGLVLERAGVVVSGRAVQRRRLAVLALLAASPRAVVSRDRILGLLWPEATSDSARHLLTDAVYELRQALGDSAILSRGDDLVLNPDVVACDVLAFEGALAADAPAEASRLYVGEFAAGLHVSDAPEFERWLDATRARYRSAWRGAQEALARRLMGAGKADEGAAAWDRLAQDDPGDEAAVLAAMQAHAAAGRRGSALRLAQVHELAMRELGVIPAAGVRELAADLKRRPTEAADNSGRQEWPGPAAEKERQGAAEGESGRGEGQDTTAGNSSRLQRPHTVAGWQRAVLAAAVGGVMLFAVSAVSRESGPTSIEAEKAAVLREIRSGPGTVLLGNAVQATMSPAAGRALVAGERAWHGGQARTAVEAFERATTADSSSAFGWYRLGQASLAADLPEIVSRRADSMLAATAAVSAPRERLLFAAYAAFRAGASEYAEQLYRTLLAQYPDDAEGWLQLGETLFHYNPPRGRAIALAGPAFERALTLDPGNWGARWHLALLAAARGDRAEHQRLLANLAGQKGIEPAQLALLGLLEATSRGDYRSAAVSGAVAALDELWLYRALWVTTTYQRDLAATEMLAEALADPRQTIFPRVLGLGVLASLQAARGDWAAAEASLDQAEAQAPAYLEPGLMRAMLVVDAGSTPPPAFVERARDAVRAWVPGSQQDSMTRLRLAGLVALSAGDTAGARRAAAAIERTDGDAALVRARLALARGNGAEAVRLLTRPAPPVWFGKAVNAPFLAETFERLTRAQALEMMGRRGEAAAWYHSLKEYVPADLVVGAVAENGEQRTGNGERVGLQGVRAPEEAF
jgi:DNA-binding SARP family transcriptional activator